jgi:hypothetical protein
MFFSRLLHPGAGARSRRFEDTQTAISQMPASVAIAKKHKNQTYASLINLHTRAPNQVISVHPTYKSKMSEVSTLTTNAQPFVSNTDQSKMKLTSTLSPQFGHLYQQEDPSTKFLEAEKQMLNKRSLELASPSPSTVVDADSESGEPKGKRRKKAAGSGKQKPSDMPRRALSAYNIFFSEQRQLILKDIVAKESGSDGEESSSACGEQQGLTTLTTEEPSVLNRTFFPTRQKRAHRKVHGKIGLVVLARTVSKRWSELSADKRKYYQDLADQDKMRHKAAMSVYQERKAAESMLNISSSPLQQGEDMSRVSSYNTQEEAMHRGMMMQAFSQQGQQESSLRQAIMAQQQQQQQQRTLLSEMMAMRQQQTSNVQNLRGLSDIELLLMQQRLIQQQGSTSESSSAALLNFGLPQSTTSGFGQPQSSSAIAQFLQQQQFNGQF